MTDESGLLRALIEAAVRSRLGAEAAADEVMRGLARMNVSVVRLHALSPREDEL